MIAEAVAGNQPFFSIACVMNYQPCIAAMNAEDSNMLSAIVSYAKQADVGIEDMTFEVGNEELSQSELYTGNLPEGSGLFCG